MVSENKLMKKGLKKITEQRLKNIALFYLKRFETSQANLKAVLKRRIDDYAYHNKDFNKAEAYAWADKIIADFVRLRYVDDARFAEIKIRDYINAGKSPRYILGKLKEKGIDETLAEQILAEQEINPEAAAMKLAKKKKLGPYNPDENSRKEKYSKDLAVLVRAGFDYDIAVKILKSEV